MRISGLVAGIFFVSAVTAQPSRSSLEIFKSQARLVADSMATIVGRTDAAGEPIAIRVNRSDYRSLTENAFFESFRAKKLKVEIEGTASAKTVLDVVVLAQEILVRELDSVHQVRSVRSVFDVRFEDRGRSEMLASGFEMSHLDTAAVSAAIREKDEENFFDRYLQPIILICGTSIIVYLFFTVRS